MSDDEKAPGRGYEALGLTAEDMEEIPTFLRHRTGDPTPAADGKPYIARHLIMPYDRPSPPKAGTTKPEEPPVGSA